MVSEIISMEFNDLLHIDIERHDFKINTEFEELRNLLKLQLGVLYLKQF